MSSTGPIMHRHSTIALRTCLVAVLAGLSALALAAPAGKKAIAPDTAAQPGLHLNGGCQGEAARPATMALQMGKSTMLRLPEAVTRRSVGNPAVVQAMLVAPDTLYIAAVDVGTTNMIVQGRSGACSVIDITVAMDPASLQAMLGVAMPHEKAIRVMAANDTLVLTGTVSDAVAVNRAVELAGAYVRRPLRQLPAADKDNATDGVIQIGNGSGSGSGAAAGAGGASARVINLLAVSAPQQVQLEVKVAEVARTLLERLETGVRLSFGSGSWTTTLATDFLSGLARGGVAGLKTNGNRFGIDADKLDGLVRILAEPNVLAISGQEGAFLAGGKFFIPVAQDNNKVTLEEKEFGVGLRFTPTVLGGGLINLKVAPEVSELSREGIGISAAGIAGTAIMPLLTTRRASTTVQLHDGQSFAIGGLVRNNLVANLKGLPGLSDVPILGALFRSTDFQQERTELVFVITARLVKPLPAGSLSLPTDRFDAPSRAGVLLGGRLEGTPAVGTAPVPPASAPAAGGPEPE